MGIVSSGRAIGGAIALAPRLHPDEGVDERIAGVGGRALAKACVNDIAPVTPGLLARGLFAVAAWNLVIHVSQGQGEGLLGVAELRIPVSTMKWASKPCACSSGAMALMYCCSSQTLFPWV